MLVLNEDMDADYPLVEALTIREVPSVLQTPFDNCRERRRAGDIIHN